MAAIHLLPASSEPGRYSARWEAASRIRSSAMRSHTDDGLRTKKNTALVLTQKWFSSTVAPQLKDAYELIVPRRLNSDTNSRFWSKCFDL